MYYNGQMNTDEAVGRLTEVVRRKHLALATERTYCVWLRRYCDFVKGLPLQLPSEHKLERFLTVPRRVSPPAQKVKPATRPSDQTFSRPVLPFTTFWINSQ